MESFTKLFGSLLVFVYHCFDRIVIRGYPHALDWFDQRDTLLFCDFLTGNASQRPRSDQIGVGDTRPPATSTASAQQRPVSQRCDSNSGMIQHLRCVLRELVRTGSRGFGSANRDCAVIELLCLIIVAMMIAFVPGIVEKGFPHEHA